MNLACESCGAALEIPAELRTGTCPYCESPQVVERPPDPHRPNPAFALGFLIGKKAAHERVRQWLKGRTLFARSGVHQAKLEEVKGIYLPAYLYSALARSEYQVDIGENYTETRTTGSGKNRRTVTEVKTEWRKLAGRFTGYLADIVVTASKGLQNFELEGVEPFDLRQLARYSPAIVSGWMVEEASLPSSAGLALAREEANAQIERRLRQFMPGDSHRNLQHRTRLEDESLDLALIPLWVFAARYDANRPPMRVVLNGQTGKVHGKVPLSWVKILSAVLAALVAAGGALYVTGVIP